MHDAVQLQIGAAPADAMIIWLHGLGADGHDFVDAMPALQLPETARVWAVFPHAHHRSITIQGGRWMPGWYDIQTMRFWAEDPVGLDASIARVHTWIQRGMEAGIDT
ncbi:carboxylesterase, partial [bacterium]|nr:carboxylesterase [bacterium]